ncbi:MAG: prepilin-type N-terminal cleavage/methylation domain-containing protein [Gemmatimonadota bacterium]
MTRRSGFTVLEVLVALMITSVVALLAYGTASAGIDTKQRLEDHQTRSEAHMIARAFLVDALRHPVEGGGSAMNDVLFAVEDLARSDGLPADAIQFQSRGVLPPLGATATWSVTLAPTPDGVRLLAIPIDASSAAPIDALLDDACGMRVRVLSRSADVEWLDRWDTLGRVPAAVAIEFFSERGIPVGAPLIVQAALETVR